MSSAEEVDQKGRLGRIPDTPWIYVGAQQQVKPISKSKTNVDRVEAHD